MKRILLWLLSTFSVLVLLFGYHTSTSGPAALSSSTSIISGSTSPSPSSSGSSSSSSSGSSSSTGDGGSSPSSASTVSGDVASTQWGPVQVELTIASGEITDVSVLQYPSGNPKDVEINNYALPTLIQETLDAQGSSIDMVSGATVTSTGYVQSLQSALDRAGL